MKILILRFSSLGDIVMTTAMIRCLRQAYPHAQIDMVTRADFKDLIEYSPHLDQKMYLQRGTGVCGLWRLLRTLNREYYDVVYDAHRSLRTMFLMPLLRANRKIYFRKHYLIRNLSLVLKTRWMKHWGRFLDRFIDPLRPLGVVYDGKGPEVFVPENLQKQMYDKWRLENLPNAVGIIPSAQWRGKRWPETGFRQVMERMLRNSSHSFIVFGGKNDTFCELITKGLSPQRVLNLQGKVSILEAAAVLKHCQYVISNDTGLMHLADALEIPQVLILGPTTIELGCEPFHPQSRLAEVNLWCRPCSKNGQAPCIRLDRKCLKEVTPELVLHQAHSLESSFA